MESFARSLGNPFGVPLVSNFTSWYRGPNAAAGALQRILHAVHLTAAKHDHGCIIDIIQKVHEHIAMWAIHAAHRGKFGLAVIRTTLIGGVGDEIIARTPLSIVSPDMAEVQPMANLVGRSSPTIERRPSGTHRAECRIQDDDTIGSRRAAGKLGIPEQASPQVANPDIQIGITRPRICPPGRGGLYCVVIRK